ncbi:hypothetical protein, partial [uncultured Dialister sp.]|uniref:hypothetical protein n=1 Tax=uncultured Dialister sp. TaxID=278064 RepID=UPI0025F2DD07
LHKNSRIKADNDLISASLAAEPPTTSLAPSGPSNLRPLILLNPSTQSFYTTRLRQQTTTCGGQPRPFFDIGTN